MLSQAGKILEAVPGYVHLYYLTLIFPAALTLWLHSPERGCALGTPPPPPPLLTHRRLTVMACLNSSPFPQGLGPVIDPPFTQEILGSIDRVFWVERQQGWGAHSSPRANCFVYMLNTFVSEKKNPHIFSKGQ